MFSVAVVAKKQATRKCSICGTEFIPKSSSNIYCSKKCNRKACRKKSNIKAEERACIICGKPYMTTRGSVSQRCPDCRNITRKTTTINLGTKKTRKCTFTPNVDNTPDGPKKEDMWMREMTEEPVAVVMARIKPRNLPKLPYPSLHRRADEEKASTNAQHTMDGKENGEDVQGMRI